MQRNAMQVRKGERRSKFPLLMNISVYSFKHVATLHGCIYEKPLHKNSPGGSERGPFALRIWAIKENVLEFARFSPSMFMLETNKSSTKLSASGKQIF